MNVPVPCLPSPPEPLITPAKFVESLLKPVVSEAPLSVTVVPATPVSEPIDSFVLSVRSAPAVPKTTAPWPDTPVPSKIAAPPKSASEPALTVVVPVYVLMPWSVIVPAPTLVRPPVPLITPL